jgi:DNA-directed RNA polymerase specialized sigma24 family protein
MCRVTDDQLSDCIQYLTTTLTEMLDMTLPDAALANDVAVDAVVLLFKKQGTGDTPSLRDAPRGALLAWAYQTARHLALQRLRELHSHERLQIQRLRKTGVVAGDNEDQARDGASVKLLYSTDFGLESEKLLETAINESLAELDPRLHPIAQLLVWGNLTWNEIAQVTGVSITKVQSAIRIIRKLLPPILERHGIAAFAYLGRKSTLELTKEEKGPAPGDLRAARPGCL